MVLLSCAGAYVSGAAGSNACPAGSVRIETEAACRTAVTAAGKTAGAEGWPFVETDPDHPRGCYHFTTNTAYFNRHAVGAGMSGTQPLCAALATTGAPPPLRAEVRARVDSVLAGGVHNNNTNGLNIDTRIYIYIYK